MNFADKLSAASTTHDVEQVLASHQCTSSDDLVRELSGGEGERGPALLYKLSCLAPPLCDAAFMQQVLAAEWGVPPTPEVLCNSAQSLPELAPRELTTAERLDAVASARDEWGWEGPTYPEPQLDTFAPVLAARGDWTAAALTAALEAGSRRWSQEMADALVRLGGEPSRDVVYHLLRSSDDPRAALALWPSPEAGYEPRLLTALLHNAACDADTLRHALALGVPAAAAPLREFVTSRTSAADVLAALEAAGAAAGSSSVLQRLLTKPFCDAALLQQVLARPGFKVGVAALTAVAHSADDETFAVVLGARDHWSPAELSRAFDPEKRWFLPAAESSSWTLARARQLIDGGGEITPVVVQTLIVKAESGDEAVDAAALLPGASLPDFVGLLALRPWFATGGAAAVVRGVQQGVLEPTPRLLQSTLHHLREDLTAFDAVLAACAEWDEPVLTELLKAGGLDSVRQQRLVDLGGLPASASPVGA